MGIESGEQLGEIVARKEAERQAGRNIFWWGIGTSLGPKLGEVARAAGGTLPVLFTKMLSRAKPVDTTPATVWRWTAWEDANGEVHDIPSHVRLLSRGAAGKHRHYALVCRSEAPIFMREGGARFDPTRCLTPAGKIPDARQVTALLDGDPDGHDTGAYRICFQAVLVAPLCVKLVRRDEAHD